MGISLENQIQALRECGIRLLPEMTIEHLLVSFDREAYENEPYLLLLVVMGGEQEDDTYAPFSEDIWHLDTECIEDHGDYAAIAHRMCDLAGGVLPMQEIEDYVDVEEEEAWLSFTLNSQKIKWEAEVDNDWVDSTIFSRFAELLAKQPTEKRFTYLDLKGQDCLIGCSTPEQLKKLRNETGLDFQWLS